MKTGYATQTRLGSEAVQEEYMSHGKADQPRAAYSNKLYSEMHQPS